ncbi:MAG: YkvA family protein [Bryobacteraceae bacterium]|jgi:uncharacterized membrane protein YkvA (DUF1232 family)
MKKTPPFFDRFFKRATAIVKNPGKVLDELTKADAKAENKSNLIKKFIEDLKLLIRLVRAWAKGDYKDVPITTIILSVAAIIYFVSPIDAIPDWIPVIGYVDDAAVVAFVIASIKNDLDAFREWEKRQGGSATASIRA